VKQQGEKKLVMQQAMVKHPLQQLESSVHCRHTIVRSCSCIGSSHKILNA
jgi:hypothetical protein